MSAGRKKQDSLDRYDTPPEVTRAFLAAWGQWENVRHALEFDIIEPAAGAGAIVEVLREWWPKARIEAYDIEPRAEGIICDDFLRGVPMPADLIITNPPFNRALEFAQHSLRMVKIGGYVVLLLRLAFLESAARAPWLHANMPQRVYVLSKRPSFTKGGTDSAAYAWFVWRKGERPDHFEGHII